MSATRCLTLLVMFSEMDAPCDKVAMVVGRTSIIASIVN